MTSATKMLWAFAVLMVASAAAQPTSIVAQAEASARDAALAAEATPTQANQAATAAGVSHCT